MPAVRSLRGADALPCRALFFVLPLATTDQDTAERDDDADQMTASTLLGLREPAFGVPPAVLDDERQWHRPGTQGMGLIHPNQLLLRLWLGAQGCNRPEAQGLPSLFQLDRLSLPGQLPMRLIAHAFPARGRRRRQQKQPSQSPQGRSLHEPIPLSTPWRCEPDAEASNVLPAGDGPVAGSWRIGSQAAGSSQWVMIGARATATPRYDPCLLGAVGEHRCQATRPEAASNVGAQPSCQALPDTGFQRICAAPNLGGCAASRKPPVTGEPISRIVPVALALVSHLCRYLTLTPFLSPFAVPSPRLAARA